MSTLWLRGVAPAAATALVNTLEAMPGNPKFTEVKVVGRRCNDPGGPTPRFAIVVEATGGNVSIGMPADGWASAQLLAAMPGAVLERVG